VIERSLLFVITYN